MDHHDHQHTDTCGCGHDHSHEHVHGEQCNCGHDHHHADGDHHHHHHEHGADCDCGHDHHVVAEVDGISYLQQDVLLALYQRQCLPLARFGVAREGTDERAYMLEPAYISDVKDTLEGVKALGAELQSLEDMGLISLDYDLEIEGYPYTEYKDSELYAYFQQVVAENPHREGAAKDTPVIELGSMALTDGGLDIIEQMLD